MLSRHEMQVVPLTGPPAPSSRAEAFDRLTQVRLDHAYRLATVLLGDREEAQDAVQEAAMQAWRDWRQLRDPDRFDAWFDRIVVNRCRDRRRRAARVRAIPVAWPDQASDDLGIRVDERDALRGSLAELDPKHREIVVLRFGADLSTAEIARLLGAREGTVKSRLHYGLRHLRASYDAAQRAGRPSR